MPSLSSIPSAHHPRNSHPAIPRPGQIVTGRLPSSLTRAAGKPDYSSWQQVDKPRGHNSDAYSSQFGSALATGLVLKVLCEKPAVAEIQRGSGKTVVVLVTRVHNEPGTCDVPRGGTA